MVGQCWWPSRLCLQPRKPLLSTTSSEEPFWVGCGALGVPPALLGRGRSQKVGWLLELLLLDHRLLFECVTVPLKSGHPFIPH